MADPGWYPDPEGSDRLRWWTGDEWGAHQGNRRQPKRWKPLVVVLVILAMLWLWHLDQPDNSPSGPVDIVYLVDGTARTADVTYATSSGDTAQQNDIDVPLVRKSDGGRGIRMTMPSGSVAYVSAQNQGSTGTISCSITLGTLELASNTSSGAYAVVTCSARIP